MKTPEKLVLIVLAGALGTGLRYVLGSGVHKVLGHDFPWGTLSVNLLGCFAFGLVWALGERSAGWMSHEVRTILLVGFMGGLTTFSSYAFETQHLMRNSQWLLAGINFVSQNMLGVLGLMLGIGLARLL